MLKSFEILMLIDDAGLNAPGFNGLIITWKTWKEKHQIKGDQGKLAKNPLILKLVFSKTQEFQLLGIVETYFNLMRMSPYIERLGVVTCLVTSPIFVEVSKCRHNFHNDYRS